MKVLIVDADPKSDVSAGFGYRDCDDSNETLAALMDAVMKDEDIPSDCYIRHQAEGIDIICSNIGLAGTEVQLVNAMSREYVLKQILYGIKEQYDVVIIDCMPSLGMIALCIEIIACTGIRISEIKYFTVERVKSGKTEVIFGEK